jgi:cytochrome c553
MFTHWQLIKYRDGRRTDPEMSPAAEKLTDSDMADLAAFYAAQTPRARAGTVDPRKVEDGRKAAVHVVSPDGSLGL